MIITKENISQQIAELDEEQLKQVAEFIAFIKFRTRYSVPDIDETRLSALYGEFADEDRNLAEEGMADYKDGLEKEEATNPRYTGRQNAVYDGILIRNRFGC